MVYVEEGDGGHYIQKEASSKLRGYLLEIFERSKTELTYDSDVLDISLEERQDDIHSEKR